MLSATLRLVRQGRIKRTLRIEPFHPDGSGGLGFVPGLITTPIVITLLMCTPAMLAVLMVHRDFAPTPAMGLTFLGLAAAFAYGVPIWSLRKDIRALKHQSIEEIATLQEARYRDAFLKRPLQAARLQDHGDVLEHLDKVRLRIEAVSEYPHLKRVLGYMGLVSVPAVFSTLAELYPVFRVAVLPLTGAP